MYYPIPELLLDEPDKASVIRTRHLLCVTVIKYTNLSNTAAWKALKTTR